MTKSKSSGISLLFILILLGTNAFLLFQMNGKPLSSLFGRGSSLFSPNAQPRAIQPRGNLAEIEMSTIELFKKASPSVVHITSINVRRDRSSSKLYEVPQGTGSGFVWDKQGHIVTNFHVIKGSQKARVTFPDQSTWNASLVGVDPDKDIAVLKIDIREGKLVPLPIGESNNLLVGQSVFAIGNPFGLDQTLTTGVISGLGREIQSVTKRTISDVIQTDAAINPGNSGGPLLDSAGRLIGINTAIYSPTGTQSAGVGFAVPVDTVNFYVPELIKYGKVERPVLGVSIFNDAYLKQLIENKVIDRPEGKGGVLVKSVSPGSGAEEAGIKPTQRQEKGILWGDLIIAINGKEVQTTHDLHKFLDKHRAGDQIKVTLYWQGKERVVTVKLQSR